MKIKKQELSDEGKVMDLYQRFMESPVMQVYYEHSNFGNVGLWEGNITTQKEACLHLMRTLVSTIPVKKGKILDVACGLGGTTSFLAGHFDPGNITAINISPQQVARCRSNYPSLQFLEMNATSLDFPDHFFDVVFCAEAAFHFNTRVNFIRECSRVLKQNGQLVLCDITLEYREELNWFIPEGNQEKNATEYEALLENNGFDRIAITDKTNATCRPYAIKLRRWATEQLFYKKINPDEYRYMLSLSDFMIQYPINNYLFISAFKK